MTTITKELFLQKMGNLQELLKEELGEKSDEVLIWDLMGISLDDLPDMVSALIDDNMKKLTIGDGLNTGVTMSDDEFEILRLCFNIMTDVIGDPESQKSIIEKCEAKLGIEFQPITKGKLFKYMEFFNDLGVQ